MAKTIDDYKKDYAAAQATGNKAAMDAAHAGAEAIRAQSGYSGGVDGSQHIALPKTSTPAPTIPTNFNGSATGVNIYSNDQDAIRKLMNENSKNWWTADDAGKAALHSQNEQLAALLGGDVSFGAGGVWSGNAKTPATSLPEYDSKYSSQVDALLDSILNRKPFSYDYKTDPSYLAYADQYKRLGDRAREDTLGDVASLNGGYASSWATSAASQAQNDYNQQLSNVIPQLYDAAYNRYITEDNMRRSDLGLVMDVDNVDYGRYRDTVDDSKWKTDFDYGAYRDTVDDEHWNRDFDHKVSQDALGQENWERSFGLETKQVEWNMSNTEAMQEYDRLVTKWQLTGIADEEVAAELGVPVGTTTESYYFNKASQELQQAKFELDKANASKTGGGGGGDPYATKKNRDLVVKDAKDNVYVLGYEVAARKVLENSELYGHDLEEYYAICAEAGISEDIAGQVYMQQYKEMKDEEANANDSKGRTKTYWKNAAAGADDPAQYVKDHYKEIVADGVDYMDLYNEVMSIY